MSNGLNVFHDASGLVTVALFRHHAGTPQQHFQDFSVNVPDDMIAIGGGGEAQEAPFGALLTASYPNNNMSSWLVSSKDHVNPEPHQLVAYAIGLKIEGMSRDQLIEAVHIADAVSGLEAHPEASASLPSGFVLVGGGFNVEWEITPDSAGSLATASCPDAIGTWTARSKDHEISSPARIHSFAIGIREELPVGKVIGSIDQDTSGQAQHPSAVADVAPGFALTGGGANVNWEGPGRAGNLLWKLTPTITASNQAFEAGSKDHDIVDPATITAFSLGIQIQTEQ